MLDQEASVECTVTNTCKVTQGWDLELWGPALGKQLVEAPAWQAAQAAQPFESWKL